MPRSRSIRGTPCSPPIQDPWGLGRLCTFTDRWGNSAIEVFNSNKTPVDVIAEYVNEGILRDTIAHFETPPTLGQTGTTSPDGPPSSHVPTPTQLQQAVAVGATGPVLGPEEHDRSQDHQVQADQAQAGPAQDPLRDRS